MTIRVHGLQTSGGQPNGRPAAVGLRTLPSPDRLACAVLGVAGGGYGAASPWTGRPIAGPPPEDSPEATGGGHGPRPSLAGRLAGLTRVAVVLRPGSALDVRTAQQLAGWVGQDPARELLAIVVPQPQPPGGQHPLDRAQGGTGLQPSARLETVLAEETIAAAARDELWCPDRAVLAPELRAVPGALVVAAGWAAEAVVVTVGTSVRQTLQERAQLLTAHRLLAAPRRGGAFDADRVLADRLTRQLAGGGGRRRFGRAPFGRARPGPADQAAAAIAAATVETRWSDRADRPLPPVIAWPQLRPTTGPAVDDVGPSPVRLAAPDLRRTIDHGVVRPDLGSILVGGRVAAALLSLETWLSRLSGDGTTPGR